MATQRRQHRDGLVIHSDRGVQGEFKWSSQRLMEEGCDGQACWVDEGVAGRSAMKSPGAPSLRRDVERLFWHEIAKGLTSEEAALAVGASQAAGTRWFRERGGMPKFMLAPLCGRYLCFEEREEIALLRAQGAGIREIARQVRRSPSTISRELRRNAATPSGQIDYRASVLQWKADLIAQDRRSPNSWRTIGYASTCRSDLLAEFVGQTGL